MLRAISPFPTVFFKRLVLQTQKQGLFGKGLNKKLRVKVLLKPDLKINAILLKMALKIKLQKTVLIIYFYVLGIGSPETPRATLARQKSEASSETWTEVVSARCETG